MRCSARTFFLMTAVLGAFRAGAETRFISGGSDGISTHAVIRRNGVDFRTDELGARVNQKIWEELSSEDRTKLVRAYGWQLNRRREHFGATVSDAMAAHYNDTAGWTALVDALKARRAARDYPELAALFGPQAFLDIPVFGGGPEVRDSAAYRRAVELRMELQQDFEIGRRLYQTLTNVKWDQVSVAVKGISGPLIRIIVDNFMTPFICHGAAPLSELAAAMHNFRVELESFLLNAQNPANPQPTPADLILRIESMLVEIERMASLAAVNVNAKKAELEALAAEINSAQQSVADDRRARGTAEVEARWAAIDAQPAPGSLSITPSGVTPAEQWVSMNQQCMNLYYQLMSDANSLSVSLAAEKSEIVSAYSSSVGGVTVPEQVDAYFSETQSRFGNVYATLRDPFDVASSWADGVSYVAAHNEISSRVAKLSDASSSAAAFLASAISRINNLRSRAYALDAYQVWMGDWDSAKGEPVAAFWKTSEILNNIQALHDFGDVIGVIANNSRTTEDVVKDFNITAGFMQPAPAAFAAGLSERRHWMGEQARRYDSLRFNYENSLSHVIAALRQFDRLHQQPEFMVDRVVAEYVTGGRSYFVRTHKININYLKELVAAAPAGAERQGVRLQILARLQELREQELQLERRLEIAQNSHVADALDIDNWRMTLYAHYPQYVLWNQIAAEFQQGVGCTLISQYDMYRNLTGEDPTLYYLISYGEPHWVRTVALCRAAGIATAMEQISGKTAAYYELLDLYNDMLVNQSRYMAMTEAEFNAFMTATTLKIGQSPKGSMISQFEVDGVWESDLPPWRLVMKTLWRQEALNTAYRSARARVADGIGVAAAVVMRYDGIHGRITTSAGVPLAGVRVALTGQMAEETTTGADGTYWFDFLPSGTFIVAPPAGFEYTPAARVVEFTGSEATADFTRPDNEINGYSMSGRVTNTAGAGVGGVQVRVTTDSGAFVADLFTDADGYFYLAGVAPGKYCVRPCDSARIFQPGSRAVTIPASGTMLNYQALAQQADRRLRASGTLAFGNVVVGASSQKTMRLYNDGNVALNIMAVLCPAGFSASWSGELAPGANIEVPVTFAPAGVAPYGGVVSIFAGEITNLVTIACSGQGVAPAAELIVGAVDFGPVTTGATARCALRLENAGSRLVEVAGITLPAGFGGQWSGAVAAGGKVSIPLTFSPAMVKSYNGQVTVSFQEGGVASAACRGEGVATRIPVAWLAERGLPVDGAADYTDPDNDGLTVHQEWLAGTDPTDTLLQPSCVAENRPAGTEVGVLSKPYADPAMTYTYTLVAGAGSENNSSFTISGNKLKTAASFDFEAADSRCVRVRRTDNNGLWYERAFIVGVTNVNEAPTGLTLSGNTVTDGCHFRATVGKLSATDPDADSFFVFTLVPGAGAADNDAFVINGVLLQVATNIAHAVKSSYSVRVRATDQGGLHIEKPFAINVINPASYRALVVRSDHGTDFLVSSNSYPAQTSVRSVMSNSTVRAMSYQYVCSGWRGSGSAPASGTTMDTGNFALAANSEIVWQWRTNVWLTAGVGAGGTVSGPQGWQRIGSTATLRATPLAGFVFDAWSGDTAGCIIAGGVITVPMTRPRALAAAFKMSGAPVVVTFDAQGGHCATASATVTPGTAFGSMPAATRAGYLFHGWWTQPGGSGVQVFPFTIVTAAMGSTLYAYWVADGGEPPDNFVPAVRAGTFDGHLGGTTPSGSVSIKITKASGALTVKIVLRGSSLSFSARAWDEVLADGSGHVTMVARSGETLDLYVNGDQVHGTLWGGSLGETPVGLDGGRNRFADSGDVSAAAVLGQMRGIYALALPVSEALSNDAAVDAAPRGAGCLSMTVGNRGAVKIAGVLADGTKVARSTTLVLTAADTAQVALFVPLYLKKGSLSGLLEIDFATRAVKAVAPPRWENPGRRAADGFTAALDLCGGVYVPALVPAYLFTADLPDTFYYAGGALHDWANDVRNVPVNSGGARLVMARGVKPKKVTDIETREVRYEYDEINSGTATISLAARTGIFKGKFTLWCDYQGDSGALVHKGVSVPYTGILTPLRDAAHDFDEYPVGMGHALVPETRPEYRTLKRSRPVWLE